MTNEDKLNFLSAYDVTSSTQLSHALLIEAVGKLQDLQQNRDNEQNDWRRRVMAAIGGFLELIGKFTDEQGVNDRRAYIISLACRASGYEKFNNIPTDRLRNIYYSFVKAQKDRQEIDQAVLAIQTELLTTNNN